MTNKGKQQLLASLLNEIAKAEAEVKRTGKAVTVETGITFNSRNAHVAEPFQGILNQFSGLVRK